MTIWRHTKLDGFLLAFSCIQLFVMCRLALGWESYSLLQQGASFFLLVFMMVYNIIVVSHLFTHTPWFVSHRLNALASLLNSINIGQSAQAYHLKHVRNHHRYNNDRKDSSGKTADFSSTFQEGENDEH